MKNKEGKEESSKRGTTESEKREGEMTNKVEKENFLFPKYLPREWGRVRPFSEVRFQIFLKLL